MQGSPFGLVYLAVDEPEGDPSAGEERLNSPKTYLHVSPYPEQHVRSYADTAARRQHGDAAGTRTLIDVLLLHRRLPTEAVLAGMAAAVTLGRLEADLVAVEARRHLEPQPTALDTAGHAAAEEALQVDGQRPPPTLRGYDTLLTPLPVSA